MKVASLANLLVLSTLGFSFIPSSQVLGNTESDVAQIEQNQIPAVGYIQTRSGKIEIKADSTYTIYNQEGRILQENITLETLKAENPDLHEMIERSIADETPMMMMHVR